MHLKGSKRQQQGMQPIAEANSTAYTASSSASMGVMREQYWESNPDLPHAIAETSAKAPNPGASPGSESPAWESKHTSMC